MLSLYRLHVPLTAPYRLSFGAVEHYDTIVIEAYGADGSYGLGEATVLTGYTDETIDDCWRVARDAAVRIASGSADDAAPLLAALSRSHPFTATALLTALDMRAGAHMLNVERETRVPLLALLQANSEEDMALAFERDYDAGYRTFKVKVGFDVADDIRHVQAAQRVIAGRALLRIDANQGYTADEATAFACSIEADGVELFEQPCGAHEWDEHMKVAHGCPLPLMLDESIYGLADIERAARLHACYFIKLKLMKLGTVTALRTAIKRIEQHGMKAVLGNGVACDIGCWMEACVAAKCIGNAGEMNGFLKARSPLLQETLQVSDGCIVLPPGYSPVLSPERIEPLLADAPARFDCRVPLGAAGT